MATCAATVVLAIGVLLCLAGITLLLNLGGAADAVIRKVTSRSLGQLAPGFAASRGGFRIYAALVLAIGVAVTGLGLVGESVTLGVAVLAFGLIAFIAASALAIVGEVRTYRALKR